VGSLGRKARRQGGVEGDRERAKESLRKRKQGTGSLRASGKQPVEEFAAGNRARLENSGNNDLGGGKNLKRKRVPGSHALLSNKLEERKLRAERGASGKGNFVRRNRGKATKPWKEKISERERLQGHCGKTRRNKTGAREKVISRQEKNKYEEPKKTIEGKITGLACSR